MYIGIPVCIYRFNIYNVVMEREKPKERQATMNTAYKNFLKDALSDYCNSNGIDLGDLIDHIEFRADHPFTVSDGNGGKRTVSEPNAFDYATMPTRKAHTSSPPSTATPLSTRTSTSRSSRRSSPVPSTRSCRTGAMSARRRSTTRHTTCSIGTRTSRSPAGMLASKSMMSSATNTVRRRIGSVQPSPRPPTREAGRIAFRADVFPSDSIYVLFMEPSTT